MILEREEEGGEEGREREIDVREKHRSVVPGTHLAGDQTYNLLVHRMMLQPTEPPGQGALYFLCISVCTDTGTSAEVTAGFCAARWIVLVVMGLSMMDWSAIFI